jgi:hypothetical protein
MSRRESRWGGSALLVLGVGAFVAGYAVHRERAERAQREQALRDQVESRRAVFARGQLGEMLSLCREGWGLGEPVALAWTRESVDAYFFLGTDHSSLRQMRCGARGVSRGPRVAHPLEEMLPAEAPSEPVGARAEGEWSRALAEVSSRSLQEGELALELVRHPLTGQVLSRVWRSGERGASAVLDPPDAPPFALLPAAPGFRPAAGESASALRPLRRHRWITETDAAFELLSRELPTGARIAELSLDEDLVDVTIDWPTPAFEGKPVAPYGDKTFDEYGVADTDWWYPRETPGFGCTRGEPLARVRASFSEAAARAGGPPISRAWYSCSPAYSRGGEAAWHLWPR